MSFLFYLRELFTKAGVGTWDTAGPEESPPSFVGAWWCEAKKKPAHPGRVGGAIRPKTMVVHTTDMMPNTFDSLVKAWTTTESSGACAHFLIGRDKTQGVVQFVPIYRNANHAGGKVHGNYINTAGLIHPNLVAIGVELHGAGLLTYKDGKWIHKDSGTTVAPSDVYVDSHHRGWQIITPYQFEMLEKLLRDICLEGLPATEVKPDASYESQGVAYYAACASSKVVGHVTLDPINKTDPGPQVMAWIRDRESNV